MSSTEFRRILGHYPTGVCAITAMSEQGPRGMVVGSFTSVSLDPLLVAFMPARISQSWAQIAAIGRFCVNVLAHGQMEVCRALSSRATDKFESIRYRLSDSGQPIIEGAIAWIDCELYAVHDAGDHHIVVGAVQAMATGELGAPLLFHQGQYGTFHPGEALRTADEARQQ